MSECVSESREWSEKKKKNLPTKFKPAVCSLNLQPVKSEERLNPWGLHFKKAKKPKSPLFTFGRTQSLPEMLSRGMLIIDEYAVFQRWSQFYLQSLKKSKLPQKTAKQFGHNVAQLAHWINSFAGLALVVQGQWIVGSGA